jgi:SAM-dependent methyltransferase
MSAQPTVNERSTSTDSVGGMLELDPARLQQFMSRVVDDMSAAMLGLVGALGDRLGLFGHLAASPCTADQLAASAGIDSRYTRDWLGALASAGYVDYDAATGAYALAPEHAMVLSAEGSPTFLGAGYQQLVGFATALTDVAQAMRNGGGLPQSSYSEDVYAGMERMSAAWFDQLLVPQWIAGVPDLARKLSEGGRVADLGCGAGRALVAMARSFPRSTFVGYDVHEDAVHRAVQNASAAGVAERVRVAQRDVAEGLDGPFDLVTTFHLMHDVREPAAVATGIRGALVPDGTWLLLESNSAEPSDGNYGPAATILYTTSLLFCAPTSIAAGAEGLGTMGLPESGIRELCGTAGFSSVRRLPGENPFNVVFEVKV